MLKHYAILFEIYLIKETSMHLRKSLASSTLLAIATLFCFTPAGYAAEQKPAKALPAINADATGSVTTAKPAETTAQEVIARVNGEPIHAIELQRAKKVIMSNQPNMQIPPERQKEFDLQALSQLTSAELLYQAGKKLEIKDIDQQIEAKINQGKSRFTDPEDFKKAVQALDMTEKDLLDYTRRDLVISNFIQQNIAEKVSVSEEESKKFYEDNIDKFKQGESVRASHILIGVDPSATADDKKKAEEKISKLRKELAGGADFATLAKENSTCPSSQQGGDLGYFGKGQMVPPFETAAFALKKGELSDIVETQFGYHIIKVMDSKKAETVAYKDAKVRIDDYLKSQKVSTAVNDYLVEARKTAKIEVLLK